MDNLSDLEVFVRVADLRSLTAAAESLGLTRSAASKQLLRLEKSLAARLIHRTTRRLSLTEAGSAAYQHAVRLLDQAAAMRSELAGLHTVPSGMLRVNAPVAFANLQFSHLMPEFLQRYPQIQVGLSITDHLVDIIEEGVDVLIRMTNDPPGNLVSRRLTELRFALCVSPAYMQRHGELTHPAQLSQHNVLLFGKSVQPVNWSFAQPERGELVEVTLQGNLAATSSESLRAAVLGGAGIALLPTFAVHQDLAEGRLLRLFAEYDINAQRGSQLHVLYLPNRYLMPKVRVFVDYLREKIGEVPYWDC